MALNPIKLAKSTKFVEDSWSYIFKAITPGYIKHVEEKGKDLCLICSNGARVKIINGAVVYRARLEAAIFGLAKGYPLNEFSKVVEPLTLGQLSNFYDDILGLTEREIFERLSSHSHGVKSRIHAIDPYLTEQIPCFAEAVNIDQLLKEKEIADSLKIPEDEYAEIATLGKKLKL